MRSIVWKVLYDFIESVFQVAFAEKLPNVVFSELLSGKCFLDSVDEFDSFDDLLDQVVTLQSPPLQLSPFGQLEDYGERCCHGSLASGFCGA